MKFLLLFAGMVLSASGQTVSTSFQDASAPGWTLGGTGFTPVLTGTGGIDPVGQGWLRLTPNVQNLATYAAYDSAINSRNTTIHAEFNFATWNQAGSGAADGITFFLYDGTKTLAVGANGGSLGYAQKTGVNGLNGGYIGLALDDWGNYSNPTEGRIGGPGFIPNAIAVRGPGDGTTGYEYINGTGNGGVPALSQQLDFPTYTARPNSITDDRKVMITLSPANQLTVSIQFGTAVPEVLYIADLSGYTRPDTLKFGFTSGTGAAASYHEIRDFSISSLAALLWDNGGANSLWGTAANWHPDGIPAAGADILFNNAYISSPQTVNLDGTTRDVRTLTLDSPYAYTLNNGTLDFDGNGAAGQLSLNVSSFYGDAAHTINAGITTTGNLLVNNSAISTFTVNGTVDNNGHDLAFSGSGTTVMNGVISDIGKLQKFDAGTLVLNAANSFSGGTELEAGTLLVGENGALGTGPLYLGDSTTLGTYDQNVSLNNGVSLRGDVTLSGAHNLTLSGGFTNFGANNNITVNNTGVTTLSGNVQLSENNTARTLTMDVVEGSSAVISGVIANGGTGAGSLVKNGEGSLTLSGANTYTGGTTLNAGTLLMGNNNVIPNTGALTLNGGTLSLNGNADQVGTLNYGNSTIDFSGTSKLLFDNYGTVAGTLVLNNWDASDAFAVVGTRTANSTFLDSLYFSGYGAGGEILPANNNTGVTGYTGTWDIITPRAQPTYVWDAGDSNDRFWESNDNWVGNDDPPNGNTSTRVIFGATGLTSGTDLTPIMDNDFTVNSLIFSNTANSYTLRADSANDELTFDGILPNIIQKSANNQTIDMELILNKQLIVDTIGSGSLEISDVISGTGGITKVGTGGRLILSANNTFTGSNIIAQGVVDIRANNALGSTSAGTSVSEGAALELQGGITVGAEALSLAGMGISEGGALRNVSGNNSMSGNISLAADTRINSDSGTLTLSGTLSATDQDLYAGGAGNLVLSGVVGIGTGTITKDGAGTLTLSGSAANTLTGGLNLNAGTVLLSKTSGNAINGPIQIGDGTGGAGADILRLNAANQINDSSLLTFGSSGRFDLNNFNETVVGIDSVSALSQITLGSGTLTVNSFENSSFAGVISGTGGLTKQGINTLTLAGPSTYTGGTLVQDGVLNIRNATSLGTAAGGTVVSNGATLQIQDSITVSGESLTLNGTGVSDTGALRNMLGNNVWTGNLTLGSEASVLADLGSLNASGNVANGGNNLIVGGPADVNLSGVVSGAGDLTKVGTGTVTLDGTLANTYAGDTRINAGTLVLSKPDGVNAIADGGATDITVNSGGTLLWGANNQIADGVEIILNGGKLDTAGYSEGTAATAGVGALTLAANSTLDLSGSGGILHFTDSAATAWTAGTALTIENWGGNLNGGGTEQVYFGTTVGGLTAVQVAQIRFVNPAGFVPGIYGARILATGEIVPVPEPATYVAIGILAALIGWRERKRLAAWLKALRAQSQVS